MAKKFMVLATIIGVFLGVGGLKFVREAYPADSFKSRALAKCLASDRDFVRFSAAERGRCYARQPQMMGYALSRE